MTIKSKAFKVVSWALCATLVSAIAWAAVGWKVDGYGNIKSGRSSVILSEGQAVNCRLSISGSTLSVVGSNGAALSASNPCVIGYSNSAIASITTATTVTFGAASNTDGNLFGIDDENWASVMPFSLGLISDGSSYYFTISRVPFIVSGAAAGALCQKDDTDCDGAGDVMILATGLTLGNWVNLNITPVGWFQATYATAGGAWTFTVPAGTGFNSRDDGTWFTCVPGQNGALGNGFLYVAGGDASNDVPVWTDNQGSCQYTYHRNGLEQVSFNTTYSGVRSANGDVAASIEIVLPFPPLGETIGYRTSGGSVTINNTSNQACISMNTVTGSHHYILGGGLNWNANGFTNANDDLSLWSMVRYR